MGLENHLAEIHGRGTVQNAIKQRNSRPTKPHERQAVDPESFFGG